MSTFVCDEFRQDIDSLRFEILSSWDIKKFTNNQDNFQWSFLIEKTTRKLIDHFSY